LRLLTLGGVIVADPLNGVTDNLLVVELGGGGDLTEDHDHSGLGGGLAGNLAPLVLLKAGIEDGVGDLVTDLVYEGEEEEEKKKKKEEEEERRKKKK